MSKQLTIEEIRQWCREARQEYPHLREKIDKIERAGVLNTGATSKPKDLRAVYAQLNRPVDKSWQEAFGKCSK